MKTPEATPDLLARQRKQLADWLACYALDCALRISDEDAPPQAVPSLPTIAPEPALPGQIRLLPPAPVSQPENERPVYVLVLPGPNDGDITIMPFSRFRLPATALEWQTDLPEPALQVLCIWNARTVAADALAPAWLVGQIPEKQLSAARAAMHPDAAAATTNTNLGPPLRHPLDPRHVYLQEERLLFDDLLTALPHYTQSGNTIPYKIPPPSRQFLRAADPPPPDDPHT